MVNMGMNTFDMYTKISEGCMKDFNPCTKTKHCHNWPNIMIERLGVFGGVDVDLQNLEQDKYIRLLTAWSAGWGTDYNGIFYQEELIGNFLYRWIRLQKRRKWSLLDVFDANVTGLTKAVTVIKHVISDHMVYFLYKLWGLGER